MIRVLVADDQPLARAGLAALLAAEPDVEVVATAPDGVQALELAASLRPDVACLDIRMPGLTGIEVTRALGDREDGGPSIPVLILTTFDLDEYVFEALEAGASGFLLKDAEPEDIVRAVRNVAAGNGTLDQTVTRRVLREFSRRRALQRVSTSAEAAGHLTPREREILELLAQGMSNDDIAAALTVEVSTVKSHIVRILPKLGVRSRLQAVVWAYQNKVVTPQD
ncbi:response regulator [Microbacterium imperiale]|uniref:DNA-binding response regulator n=1 Tax=Microbacterium imperiale TaxID=33884 RepID=A0A9W6HDY1_9MICO|nr:response regulator transcription factor [Microbacterium imperiale]MBP2419959.1 DNA-binding NarL/FixJ family response regulator [Microbacterium imperiale]MDS0198177.1 response regulator transcription factor [Microbacterium imperiale]BFE40299.1 response regulator transcription factor [Microbacterium imperiale]GLJ78724.1 DNA-binding response regulator [Microbacterium imperiale]